MPTHLETSYQRMLGRIQPEWHGIDSLHLLVLGENFFPRLIAEINQAVKTIWLETYIFSKDIVGQQVVTALSQAAQRGVTVKVITDWIGTPKSNLMKKMVEAGVEHRIYNPSFFSWRFGISRTHRKLAVIDSRIAFVGGINLIDDFNSGNDDDLKKPLPAPRWDFATCITGSITSEIEQAIALQWHRIKHPVKESFYQTKEFLQWLVESETEARKKNIAHENAPIIAFVARDNIRQRRTIERAYLQAIGRSRKEVLLANPYFVPGRRLRRALMLAALRGVKVTLLLGHNEFWMLDSAVPAMYGALLGAGVVIAEYDKTLLHGKVAVVDGVWATVGSSNCDALSFVLNNEANIVVQNHEMVTQLKHQIEKAVQEDARIIDPKEFSNRSIVKRISNWMAYISYRVMMKILTIGRYQ